MNQFMFERKELQILYPTRTNSWFVLKQIHSSYFSPLDRVCFKANVKKEITESDE